MGYFLAGWVGLLHSVLHKLACLSGSWAVRMLPGVGCDGSSQPFGDMQDEEASLQHLGCVAEAGMVGYYEWYFGWGVLVPCGVLVLGVRAALSICRFTQFSP